MLGASETTDLSREEAAGSQQLPLYLLQRDSIFHTHSWLLIAYDKRDNFLSCLGCVTDWQQETRGLFLWPELWYMPAGHFAH